MTKCLCCGKETNNPKFCCRSCSAKITNLIPKRKKVINYCPICGSTTTQKGRKCKACVDMEKLETRVAIDKTTIAEMKYKLRSMGYQSSSYHVKLRNDARDRHKNLTTMPCYICGYDKHVEIAHIKAVRDFEECATIEVVNDLSNIVQLCPNCHWEFDNGLVELAPKEHQSV